MMRDVILQSTITCPSCGHRSCETMPTDACRFFFVCPGCGERLKPRPGDCCVFCSYGTDECDVPTEWKVQILDHEGDDAATVKVTTTGANCEDDDGAQVWEIDWDVEVD